MLLRSLLLKIFTKRIADIFIMMLTILPITFKIIKIQQDARYSRLFELKNNFFKSIKMISIPLIMEMFQITDEMADAWYSRGYNSNIKEKNR